MISIDTGLGHLVDVVYNPQEDQFISLSRSGYLYRWGNQFDEPVKMDLKHSQATKLSLTPTSAKAYFSTTKGLHTSDSRTIIDIPPRSLYSEIWCLSEHLAIFAYIPEGYSRASCTLYLVDLKREKGQAIDPIETSGVSALAAIPNSRTIAWVNWQRQLHIRNLTSAPRRYFSLKNTANALCFNRFGTKLAIGNDWEILLFDVESFPSTPKLIGRHRGVVQSLTFLPDSRYLLSGSSDRTVRIWDVESTTLVQEFDWQIGRIEAVACDTDGMRGIAVSHEGKMLIWDLDT